MTLAQFMDKASGTSAYGFDYEAMCSCSMLLDKFPPLRYFQGDVLTTDEGFAWGHWPVVIAGNAGSASALHVDAGMLPFWMHVLGGGKTLQSRARKRPGRASCKNFTTHRKYYCSTRCFLRMQNLFCAQGFPYTRHPPSFGCHLCPGCCAPWSSKSQG